MADGMGSIFGNIDSMLADDPEAWRLSPNQLRDRIAQMGMDKLKREMYLNYISPGLRGSSQIDRMNSLMIDAAVPRRRLIETLTK